MLNYKKNQSNQFTKQWNDNASFQLHMRRDWNQRFPDESR